MKEPTTFNIKELLEVADCCFADKGYARSNCTNCPYYSDDDCKQIWEDEIHDLPKLFVKKNVTKIEFGPDYLDNKKFPTVLVVDANFDESALTDVRF